MRLFIATEFPHAIKEDIQAVIERIRTPVDRMAEVRWIGPAQFHLTLKFLGDCQETKVPLLIEAIRTSVYVRSNFHVQLLGLGCFPNTGPPKVLWLGVSQGETGTYSLATAIEESCESLGFPKEKRPYNAHLTLGRIKRVRRSRELPLFLQRTLTTPIGPALIDRVNLIQSHLTPSGPRYETLESIPLAKGGVMSDGLLP